MLLRRGRRTLVWASLSIALVAAFRSAVLADETNGKHSEEHGEASQFLRLQRGEGNAPRFMETAIVHYVAPDDAPKEQRGLAVDLIGVVHIGERDYYERLNKEFEKYDVLLYELVAPEGTRVPKGGRGGGDHPIGMLQDGMKDMLELEHQLQYVDYQKENFVHADMSPEEFEKSMAARGESFFTMFFRMMGQSLAMQSKNGNQMNDLQILMALFDPNRALAMKRLMAEQFQDMELAINGLDGPEGSTIISERNKKALSVLKEQIKDGKKKIGIFYGAGHMPDMEKRLLADFGLRRDGDRWLAAWDLRTDQEKRSDKANDSGESDDESSANDPEKTDRSGSKDGDSKETRETEAVTVP
jgi:hypothetical protein